MEDGTLGAGVFNGNGGTHRLDYSGIAVGAGVAVDLAAGTADRTSGVTGIREITGSTGDDKLNGDAQVNTIRGGPGNDTIDPNGGPGTPGDIASGDEGDDIIIWDPGEGTDFVDGGTGSNTQIVNRGGGNNAMFVRVDDIDPTHTFFDGTGFTINLVQIQRLVVNAQGGTDTLTVGFVNGSPFTNLSRIPGGPGLSYDGGLAADRLVLRRLGGAYTATSETYTATGPVAGEISFDGGVIAFTSLDPVDDTVPATNFTVSLPPGGNLVVILDGPVVSGFATTQIAGAEAPPAFELINFANKTNATLNLTAGDDDVTFDNPAPAVGMTRFTLNALGGSDTVDLAATGTGVAYEVDAGSANDLVTMVASAVVTGGTYDLDGGTGIDTLIVDAQGAAVTVSAGVIHISGLPPIGFARFENVTINNTVAPPPVPGPPVTINATEGMNLVDAVVATFTTTATGATADAFVATINWGDATQSAGLILQDASDPSVFYVQWSHLYLDDGTLPVIITLRTIRSTTTSTIGGATITINAGPSASVTASSTAIVGDAPIVSQGVPVVGIEDSPPTSVIVATFQTIDPNATAAGFTAMIEWGDGTTSAGTITAIGSSPDGVTFRVAGTTTFDAGGQFAVRVTIASAGGSTAESGTIAIIEVAPLPLDLNGRLDPSSDSGISDSDGITFVRQPTFFGTAEDGAIVTLSARSVDGGPAIALGRTVADASGTWRLTSEVALIDGRFDVTASIVDRDGVTVDSKGLGVLTIDTIGPRVTALGFARNPGILSATFRDERSGLAQRTIVDNRNFRIERPQLRNGRLLFQSLDGRVGCRRPDRPADRHRADHPEWETEFPRRDLHSDDPRFARGHHRRRRQPAGR